MTPYTRARRSVRRVRLFGEVCFYLAAGMVLAVLALAVGVWVA